MTSFIIRILLASLAVGSAASFAGPINSVMLGGREWLQPVDFVNNSWDDVSAVCDPLTGQCSGSLGGISLDGWAWAGTDDVKALFNAVYGSNYFGASGGDQQLGTGGVGDAPWATAFFDAGFLPTSSGFDPGDFTPVRGLAGITRTLATNGFYLQLAVVTDALQNGSSYQHDRLSIYDPYVVFPDYRSDSAGHFFFRVPLPGTLPLLVAGLWILRLGRRPRG